MPTLGVRRGSARRIRHSAIQRPIMSHFGLLNINKPAGVTSRDVVNRVDRLIRPARAGHAGTLDPLATGVLVVCIGPATRLVEYVQRMPKRYLAKFLLGRTSETEDVEGEITLLEDPPQPTRDQIERAAENFLGVTEQRPPRFSALKVEGRRAYQLARAGQPVELAARKIRVDRVDVVAYDYPELTLDIECGSGTYIRSLGRDLAESLGTGAVMAELTRTAIGRFGIEQACDLDELSADTLPSHILPAGLAVDMLPRVELDDDQLRCIGLGQTIDAARVDVAGCVDPAGASGEIVQFAAFDQAGRLRAILIPRSGGGLRPRRNFPLPE